MSRPPPAVPVSFRVPRLWLAVRFLGGAVLVCFSATCALALAGARSFDTCFPQSSGDRWWLGAGLLLGAQLLDLYKEKRWRDTRPVFLGKLVLPLLALGLWQCVHLARYFTLPDRKAYFDALPLVTRIPLRPLPDDDPPVVTPQGDVVLLHVCSLNDPKESSPPTQSCMWDLATAEEYQQAPKPFSFPFNLHLRRSHHYHVSPVVNRSLQTDSFLELRDARSAGYWVVGVGEMFAEHEKGTLRKGCESKERYRSPHYNPVGPLAWASLSWLFALGFWLTARRVFWRQQAWALQEGLRNDRGEVLLKGRTIEHLHGPSGDVLVAETSHSEGESYREASETRWRVVFQGTLQQWRHHHGRLEYALIVGALCALLLMEAVIQLHQ